MHTIDTNKYYTQSGVMKSGNNKPCLRIIKRNVVVFAYAWNGKITCVSFPSYLKEFELGWRICVVFTWNLLSSLILYNPLMIMDPWLQRIIAFTVVDSIACKL